MNISRLYRHLLVVLLLCTAGLAATPASAAGLGALPMNAALAPQAEMPLPPALARVQPATFEGVPARRPLMRPRRFLPPQMRSRPRPPQQRRQERPRSTRPAVRIPPSQALRLAQRRWPNSIGLSVRLLKRATPVYAVKLKAGSRVVQVLVDATTGMILH